VSNQAELPFEVGGLVMATRCRAAGRAPPDLGVPEHPTFTRYHAEHELLRYLTRLQAKDLSLTTVD